jgi:glutamate-ammonia-ligase adenylyltransferase
MGKLGARELNVSSDIDLIYVYEHDGDTAGLPDGRGASPTTNTSAAPSRPSTPDRRHHRARLCLPRRPGAAAQRQLRPAAVSLASLEEYLQVQGREWERFAWLKSRIVAPAACIGTPKVQALRGVVLPFVFRRYLDYSVFDALRSLHRQIRDHATSAAPATRARQRRQALARRHPRDRIHRAAAAGGARRPVPELRCRPTLEALQRLARAGLMPPRRPTRWPRLHLLRRVEHRIQYLDDQQTHVLPTRDDDLEWIARTMGFAAACAFCTSSTPTANWWRRSSTPCWAATAPAMRLRQLRRPRQAGGPATPDLEACWNSCRRPAPRGRLAQQPPRAGLRDEARARLFRLVQRTAQWVARPRQRRSRRALDQLAGAAAAPRKLPGPAAGAPGRARAPAAPAGRGRWPARYLLQHPGVIDELASDAMLAERFVAADFEHELALRPAALQSTGEDDDETLLNLLRRAHHAEVFRTLARDVEGASPSSRWPTT